MLKRPKSKTNASMFAVLGILALGPHTGYDIKKLMERSTKYFWNENFGQIYPHLNRLLHNGDATMQIEQQDGKPDRKVYSITEQGRRSLADWLSTPLELHATEHKNELLLRLFFGPHIPAKTNIQHLNVLKSQLQQRIQELDTIEEEIRDCYPDDVNRRYWLITTNYGKLQAGAILNWCDESIALLEESADL